jgi:glucosamine--fructose-6-phosphate aminotransferase (isomerizing)
MCGIVGYVGKERCVEVLMEGLRNLEYRGYDSAGLAVALPGSPSSIETAREVGPLDNLAGVVGRRDEDFFSVRAGVGHTRWATHGRPSEANAHPHKGGGAPLGPEVAIVHNGIIENHAELRDELVGRGVVFSSETDTEVLAHLLAERVADGESLKDALVGALGRLEGSFAVAAMSAAEPETIVAARNQSPLVVGLGEGENFLASAVQALLGYTRRFVFVENGEVVSLTGSSVEISTLDGLPVERETFEVDWSAEAIELGGYEDFMLKEIHEQPAALRATLSGRLEEDGSVDLSELGLDLSGVKRVVVVACGTAYHAGLLAKQAIEKLARVHVEVAIASEYRYADPVGTRHPRRSRKPERRDYRHPGGRRGGARFRRARPRGDQHAGLAHHARGRRGAADESRPRGRGRLHQDVRRAGRGAVPARARARGGERRPARRELRGIGRSLRLAPEKVEEAIGLVDGTRDGGRPPLRGGALLAVPGPRGRVPARPRRGVEAQGDLLPPLRGIPRRRDEARPHSPGGRTLPRRRRAGRGLLREKTLPTSRRPSPAAPG